MIKHAVWGGPKDSLDECKQDLDVWAQVKGYQREGEYRVEQREGRWWVEGDFSG